MTEHHAVAAYRRRVHSATMLGAFRKGYRARDRSVSLASNPYREHRATTGWGRRVWEAWVDGWNARDAEDNYVSRYREATGVV